jgi:hypothetical protein
VNSRFTKLAGMPAETVTSGASSSPAAQKFPFAHSAMTGRNNSSFSRDIGFEYPPGWALGRQPRFPFARGCRTKGPGDKHPNEAQMATGATGQAACKMSAWWTRPRLPGLLTRAEIGSYRPGLGLCDSLA